MSLRRYIERGVIRCSPEDTVNRAVDLMKTHDVGAVVVEAEGKPKGILTDRDIVLRCLGAGREVSSTTVEEVMTGSVESVSLDDGIYNVIKKMKEGTLRRVPIVDESGRAVALLSFGDVFDLIAEEIGDLREIVSPPPKIVSQAA